MSALVLGFPVNRREAIQQAPAVARPYRRVSPTLTDKLAIVARRQPEALAALETVVDGIIERDVDDEGA